MDQKIHHAAHIIKNARYLSAFTGAGVSTESGIPPFRGKDGLWSRYDPDLFTIDYFSSHPAQSWEMLVNIFYETFKKASPNQAHITLARLEEKGLLKILITQNIDNLHHQAGSSNVVEYHGDCRTLVCLKCRKKHPVSEELIKNQPPVCNCGGVLKPNFIFFGEPIPVHVQEQVENTIEQTDAMLVVGTTGEVFPASLIPLHAKERGARIIEVNTKPSNYTGEITDVFLQGKASEVLPQIEDQLA